MSDLAQTPIELSGSWQEESLRRSNCCRIFNILMMEIYFCSQQNQQVQGGRSRGVWRWPVLWFTIWRTQLWVTGTLLLPVLSAENLGVRQQTASGLGFLNKLGLFYLVSGLCVHLCKLFSKRISFHMIKSGILSKPQNTAPKQNKRWHRWQPTLTVLRAITNVKDNKWLD